MSLVAASPAFETALRQGLPTACFRPLEPRYLEDPRGLCRGTGGMLLTPASADEVALILRACNQYRVGLVPYGGGTGLVGGQIKPDPPPPVILSLERMNKIRALDTGDNVMIVEAGAILADVQAAASAANRLFPLSLASEGSCRIGGNLATNAGGVQVLRYGNARDLCLGLEAVLPDGSIWHGLKRLRKDNAGYDIRNLLIGSEGSLGVITAAALKLFPKPGQHVTAFVQIRDPLAALELLAACRDGLGNMVSAFELIDRQGFEFLRETLPHIRLPFVEPGKWMVLLEIGVVGDLAAEAALEGVLGRAMETGIVRDAVIAQTQGQRQDFWTVRETIPEANRLVGAINSHDISVPISKIPDMIARGRDLLAPLGDFRINAFGHVGDGNLHYNVYPPKGRKRDDFAALKGPIKAVVYGLVHDLGGSISAEHGIGRSKRVELLTYADPAKIALMRRIKAALDPNGIMNPGAVIG